MIGLQTRATAAVVSLSLAATLSAALSACERTRSAADGDIAPVAVSSTPATPSAAAGSTIQVSAPPPTLADTVDPAATLRAYLARARMHQATRDTLIWDAAAGSTSGFRAFADTTIATFTVGSPGRIEGAAGSRYVTIPIDVDVVSRGAAPVTLHGMATLRRAVVDGASEAQRRWRITRIEWSAAR